MVLFWRDDAKESHLMMEPCAKLCSLGTEGNRFTLKCLGVFQPLSVPTLAEAKRLTEVRLIPILQNILDILKAEKVCPKHSS